ncbi:MAG: glycosyltransferase [Candidatus Omnitrophota bacterium]|nr:glycosyltransferase [Candidatus Omnitrophota bacterium]
MPEFSVLMTSYNYARFLPDSIESVLSQTCGDWELLIVDDASQDASWEIIAGYHDTRIRKRRLNETVGASRAYQEAYSMATGNLIACLDSDDAFEPEKLERQLNYMCANPHVHILGTFIQQIGCDGLPFSSNGDEGEGWFNRIENLNDPSAWVWQNRLCHSAAVVRKTFHDRLSFRADLRSAPDWDFWLRCLEAGGQFHVLPEKLTRYRIHKNNASRQNPAATFWEYADITARHFHPYLESIHRADLIENNLCGFFTHPTYAALTQTERRSLLGLLFGLTDLAVDMPTLLKWVGHGQSTAPKAAAALVELAEQIRKKHVWGELLQGNIAALTSARLEQERWAEEMSKSNVWWENRAAELQAKLDESRWNTHNIRGCLRYIAGRLIERGGEFISKVSGHRSNTRKTAIIRNQTVWNPNAPLVTVIIPCYNYGSYIRDAVSSVSNQTWTDLEVLIIDDGSDQPKTLSALESLSDIPRTRVIHQKNNGLPAARNRGIEAARGKYICCLDADDMLAPTYLEKCLYYLEAKGFDICGSLQQNFGDDDSVLDPGEFNLRGLLKENRMIGAAVYPKALWNEVDGYDEKMTLGFQDWEFWIRAAQAGANAHIIREPLFHYRRHTPSMVQESEKKRPQILKYLRDKHAALYRQKSSLPKKTVLPNTCVQNPFVNLTNGNDLERTNTGAVMLCMPFMTMGGAERVLSQAAQDLSAKGFTLYALTTEPVGEGHVDVSEWFGEGTRGIFHFTRFLPPENWRDYLFYLLKRHNIKILWLAGTRFVYELLPLIKRDFPHIKVVDNLFNEIGHTSDNRKFSAGIDLNVVENNTVAAWLKRNGESDDRIVTVPNGVDILRFQPDAEHKLFLRGKLNLPSQTLVVGFFGRYADEKGPDLFLDVAKQFRNEPNVLFLMSGTGPMAPKLRTKLRWSRLKRRVTMTGCMDPRDFYALADIMICPSRADGRPNAALEAMACGLPLIASDVGGFSEFIREGSTGFLCEPGNIQSFVQKLHLLLRDAKLFAAMKRQSRDRAERHLSIRPCLDAYEQVFRKLLTPDTAETTKEPLCAV